MRPCTALLLSAAAACCALAAGPAAGPAQAAAGPAGHWGNGKQLPGLSTLSAGDQAAIESISCAAPGNCVAVGSYGSLLSPHAFYAEEKGGTWGKAKPVFTGNITSDLVSVSCGDAADCVAVGFYTPHLTGFPDELPLVLNKVSGTWEFTSEPLPPGAGDSHAMSVSCPSQSPENCTMGGWFNDAKGVTQPFTADEHDGLWGPERLPGALQVANVGPDTTVSSVSCASPGNCSAVGHYTAAGSSLRSFVMDEFGGTWTPAHPIPQLDTLTMSRSRADTVSCATPGNCALAGEYWDTHGNEQAFVIDEVNGDWIKPEPVPGIAGPSADAPSFAGEVSCAAPGRCVVAGSYIADARTGTSAGFAAQEKNGAWQPAIKIAGSKVSIEGVAGSASSVSCTGAGNCDVGGSITDGAGVHPMVLDEASGTWGSPHRLSVAGQVSGDQFAGVLAISCASHGNCAAGGEYQDKAEDLQGFVADESTATTTTLKLSAAKVTFGHEQSEKLSVKVMARTGGTPSGKVTVVAGSTTLCTIKLVKGKGSCTPAAEKLKPGRYRLTGTYGGDRKYAGSAYPAQRLSVVK